MSLPNEKPKKRKAGPKSPRPAIPSEFSIRRTPLNPMRQMLEESAQATSSSHPPPPDFIQSVQEITAAPKSQAIGHPQLESSGYPQDSIMGIQTTKNYGYPQDQTTATHEPQLVSYPHIADTGSQSVQPPGYPPEPVATHVPTGSDQMATHVPTRPKRRVATSSKSNLRLRTEGKRRINERQISVRLDIDLLNKINTFCLEYGITAKEFWETLAVHAVEPGNPVATHAFKGIVKWVAGDDHDDIHACDDNIIMRYKELTGQTWTRRDDREARRYNGTDPRIIDIALVMTIERKLRGNTSKEPVKSFAYFKPEIELLLQQKKTSELPATLDEYHRYVMSAWEKRIKPIRDQKWGNGTAKNG
jgi:hypothetical protein